MYRICIFLCAIQKKNVFDYVCSSKVNVFVCDCVREREIESVYVLYT